MPGYLGYFPSSIMENQAFVHNEGQLDLATSHDMKNDPKSDVKSEMNSDVKSNVKSHPISDVKNDVKSDIQSDTKTDVKSRPLGNGFVPQISISDASQQYEGAGVRRVSDDHIRQRRRSSDVRRGSEGVSRQRRESSGLQKGSDVLNTENGRPSFSSVSMINQGEGTPGQSSTDFRDPPVPTKAKWDSFRMSDEDQYHASADMCWTTVRKVFRVLTLLFTFLIVLMSAMFSKILLLLISTNIVSNSPGSQQVSCRCHMIAEENEAPRLEWVYDKINRNSSANDTSGDFAELASIRWTWSLVLVIVLPYVFTFLKSLWNIIGCKSPKWYGCKLLFMVLILECLHTCGIVLLTTRVLPELDMLYGVAALLGVGVLPSMFKVFSHGRALEPGRWFKVFVDAFSFLLQLSVPVAFAIHYQARADKHPEIRRNVENEIVLYVSFCTSFILVSVRWWPNYINRFTTCFEALRNAANGVNTDEFNSEPTRPRQRRKSYRQLIRRNNYLLHLIISAWKILLTILGVLGSTVLKLKSPNLDFGAFFSMDQLVKSCSRDCPGLEEDQTSDVPLEYAPYVVFAVQAGCGILCYFVGLHACKVNLQKSGFALPLFLTTPASFGVVILFGQLTEKSSLKEFMRDTGMLLNAPDVLQVSAATMAIMAAVTTCWWLSQTRVASHVWFPLVSRISTSERLFLTPMFDSEVLEQSLLYNRRNDLDYEKTPEEMSMAGRKSRGSLGLLEDFQPNDLDGRDPDVDFIYLCATMWHENDDEMKQILKSIYRLDKDQNWRKNAQEYFGVNDPDYYEFEAHIFFDDAFTEYSESDEYYSANNYVKQLIRIVPTAASSVHKKNVLIEDPVRIPTPYGGRLEWKLPGGNMLIAHLKDKMKIRHKKRWSQVMYMYYFLGHRIVASEEYTPAQKVIMAKKTYLLALDGDVDFQPEAVHLLVDMMKRNEDVGATCGRIHPIGSGLMVWYQKFEYAVSHWLQKATEHILGCVLCSPGCFSMFRGSALMDDNVMRRYATPSTEAAHYLQYDQGEDRWLCTLLLQQGYRVEYNAAADALTYAPEGFNEFYNQRRRWGPSTMANILDLIMDIKHVVKVNRYMSFAYIVYQAVMFFASVLGPGTIFLMVTGALALILKGGDDLAFILNAIPIVLYIIISYFTPADFQLKVASLLSALYALVMGMVMVSVAIEINQNICSSSAIFFFVVSGTFLLAALLHPQEIIDVIYGVAYYLLIPCMYLLLIIYSMVNLNNVSWGTREVKSTAVAKVPEAKAPPKRQSLSNILTSFMTRSDADAKEHGATYSCGNTCRIVCCPRPREQEEDRWFFALNHKLDNLTNKVNSLTSSVYLKSSSGMSEDIEAGAADSNDDSDAQPLLAAAQSQEATKIESEQETPEETTSAVQFRKSSVVVEMNPRDDLINPYWIEEADILNGPIQTLDKNETAFWTQLVGSYLKPLENNEAKQKEVARQLLELRNKVTFGFFLMNAMFVVIIFTLQKQKDVIYVEWPCLANGETQKEKIDPIGLMFLSFFILVMFIQVIGMIFHRLGTFFHIMASTTVNLCTSLTEDGKLEKEKSENARAVLELAKNIGGNDKGSDSASNDDAEGSERRRQKKSILMEQILGSAADEPVVVSLDEEFKEKVEEIDMDLEKEDMDHHSSVLANMPSSRQKTTVHYLREQRTIVSMRRSQASAPGRVHWPRGGRHISKTSVDDMQGRIRCDSIQSSYTDAGSLPRASIEMSVRNMDTLVEEDQTDQSSLTHL